MFYALHLNIAFNFVLSVMVIFTLLIALIHHAELNIRYPIWRKEYSNQKFHIAILL